jgi:hypothetical protein
VFLPFARVAAGRQPAPLVLEQPLRALPPASALAGLDQYRRPLRRRFARLRCIRRGDWVWRWKDWIDRRFMPATICELPADGDGKPAEAMDAVPLDAAESTQAISAIAMRCGGCGAKVGATCCRERLPAAPARPRRRADRLACSRRCRRRARAAGQGDGA